jgi:diguanylate cyclase (GGDEF)-like protein
VATPGIWTAAVHDGRPVATSASRARLVAVTSRAVADRPGWSVQALATPSALADPLPVTVAGVGATATILLAAALGVWSIQARRRQAVEHRLACTYQESRVDALTGLANRVQLMEWLDAEVATCRRAQCRLGLMFIDVDRFKTVNDTMGHAVGDELLKEVASRLGTSVRAGDLVGRLAGDEFVIAFPGVADPATLGELAERVARAFDAPVELSTGPFFASLSIGLAITDGALDDLHTLLAQADAAMYVAKGTPGSHYAFFDEALRAEADNRHATGEALRAGIAAGELSLSYQPIVAVPDGTVTAVEAFIRWNRPGIGVLTPASFLDVAEETGLISVLGRWVLTQACRQAAAWNPPGTTRPMPVAVNVSERELLGPGFVAAVGAALADTGLAPALLAIELTESLALDRRVAATGVLAELGQLGVGLVIDDFGLRHGSLGLLKQLDLAMVKIHGSTAKAVTDDEAERAVVGAVVNLARVLGAVVVAESVETPAQLQALHQLGVGHMQGHLLLPPVPPAELGPMADDRHLGDLCGLTTVAVVAPASPGEVTLVDLAGNAADAAPSGGRDATPSGHRPFRLARVDRRR